MARKQLYQGKVDVCSCGKPKTLAAEVCWNCWIESAKAKSVYCKCGREKSKYSTQCHVCKKEAYRATKGDYWKRHDYCKCGNEKRKDTALCRACWYVKKRAKNPYCRDCGVKLGNDNRYPSAAKNNEKLCKQCHRERAKKRCQGYRERYAEKREELKREVFNAYGNKCTCCGISDLVFLAIDHIENNGRIHRLSVPGNKFYMWLKLNNYPSGFQILCHNCNWAKYRGGCPHQQKQTVAA